MCVLNKLLLFVILYNLAFTESTCPNVKPADNFNLAKFASGTWHDIAISSNDLSTGDIFASLNYEYDGGDEIKFKTENVPETDPNFVSGFGKVISNGKILYTYLAGDPKHSTDIVITVMAVDDDFASLYGCLDDSNKLQDIVWVSSRTKEPQGSVKAKIQNYLNSFISPTTLEKVTWTQRF